jgi:hypothetical protein
MDKNELAVESLKLLQDWSKWLITLEAAVCAALWSKLTGGGQPPLLLYLGWMMFWGSIITAAFLLIAISIYARRVTLQATVISGSYGCWLGLNTRSFLAACFASRADSCRCG